MLVNIEPHFRDGKPSCIRCDLVGTDTCPMVPDMTTIPSADFPVHNGAADRLVRDAIELLLNAEGTSYDRMNRQTCAVQKLQMARGEK